MRETSIIAYLEITPELGERQKAVLDAFLTWPDSTDLEITFAMGFQNPDVVRPRRKELYDMDLLSDMGKRKCTISGKSAHFWRGVGNNNEITVPTGKFKKLIPTVTNKEVFDALVQHPCSTDYELAFSLGYRDPNVIRPVRNSFVKKGLVVDAGKRVCNVSQRKAHTWKIVKDNPS